MSMKLLAALAIGAVLLCGSPAAAQVAAFPSVTLSTSSATCASIERSDGLLVYTYRLSNPRTSDTGIESFHLDIGAPLGVRPEVLSTEGIFVGDGTRNPAFATRSHAPVGVGTPGRWRAMIDEAGVLTWWSPGSGLAATDPVRPGTTRAGFNLRSSFLPGIAEYRLVPDYPHVCCPYPAGDPRNDEVEVRKAEEFQVVGHTLAPVYAPGSATLERLVELQDRACDLGWIGHRGVCNSLMVKLTNAQNALRSDRTEAAAGHLRSYAAELEAQHGPQPGKHVGTEAYLLLHTHAVHLLGRM